MLKNNLLTIATLTGIGFLPLAQAADQLVDKRWYIAPFGTLVVTDDDRHADNGWGGGMGFGKMLNEHFNVELKGFYEGFGAYSPVDSSYIGTWQLAGGTADVQYFFNRNRFAPYTVIGLGGMNTHFRGNDTTGFIGEAGLGFTYEVSNNFLLRSDVRYRYNNNQDRLQGVDQFHDMTVNVGFVIPFGAKPTYMAQAEAPIVDAPVAVAPDCSTLDADADGVNDCVDRCPGTPEGSKVDNSGCPVRLILKGQHFKYDSAELTVKAKEILDSLANSLTAYPQKNDIEVQGHASSEGSNEYNMRLSERRAASVVDYLRAKGIANKLTATAFGETRPVADNSTEAGRSENRRVELIWIEN
ncbi:MAG: flagellar motor protein MotB [Methylobacter sp.]|nr:MAG: flagellar motor protein MotB [Methylobacter sp.]